MWVTVGSGGVVVGYVYTPNSFARDPLPPDLQNPDCHPELSIYDEAGLLIGSFIDGVPVITE